MDADLIADLASKAPVTVLLYTVVLDGSTTLYWTDGGFVVWGANTYVARNAYGVISESEEITDGIDGEATINSITILPADNDAFDALSAQAAQGALVTQHLGSVDFETGLLTGEPELLLRSEIDEPRLSESGDALILDCITEEARMLEPNDERRLTDSFNRIAWPDENGLKNVTTLKQKRYWRAENPNNAIR